MSISFLRATHPCLLARMVNQVGSPAMFEGKRFLPETGIPIWKILRSNTMLADCEPEPLTVATWMEKSFTTLVGGGPWRCGCTTTSVAITRVSFAQTSYEESVSSMNGWGAFAKHLIIQTLMSGNEF